MGSTLSPVIANFYMEDFESRAIEQAPFKPKCWYRYVDDTFVIWPHGLDKLQGFLDHLNSLQDKIQFTIETEKDGHLPFLDIDIYRKIDGTLGHKVYRKQTHTNLYLQQSSHHHPAHKQSVLTSLIHRARGLCDEASLPQELEILTSVFKNNGYKHRQKQRALLPRGSVIKNKEIPICHIRRPHLADSAECWPSTTLKVWRCPQGNQLFPTTSKRISGLENPRCLQHPLRMRKGLCGTKRPDHPTPY